MVWNTSGVSSIVESFYSADNAKKVQNQTGKSSTSFSDVLTAMYQNYQTGLLTGSSSMTGYPLYGSSGLTGYPLSGQSDYLWQTKLLGLLAEKLSGQESGQQAETRQTETKKPDWAKFRVIHRYQQDTTPSQEGILI